MTHSLSLWIPPYDSGARSHHHLNSECIDSSWFRAVLSTVILISSFHDPFLLVLFSAFLATSTLPSLWYHHQSQLSSFIRFIFTLFVISWHSRCQFIHFCLHHIISYSRDKEICNSSACVSSSLTSPPTFPSFLGCYCKSSATTFI